MGCLRVLAFIILILNGFLLKDSVVEARGGRGGGRSRSRTRYGGGGGSGSGGLEGWAIAIIVILAVFTVGFVGFLVYHLYCKREKMPSVQANDAEGQHGMK